MQAASRSSGSARSRRRRGGVVAAVAAFAVVLLAGAPASARRRVVVMGFDGPQAGKAEAAVARVVKKKYDLVPAEKYTKAQKKLRLKKQTNANVAKIAAEIQIDAIVSGSVKRRGARWSLILRVREGASGGVVDTITIPLRAPRVDKRAEEDIAAQLLPSIGRVTPVGGGGADDGASARKGKKGDKKKKRPAEPEDDEDDDGSIADDSPPPPPVRETRVAAAGDDDDDPDTAIRKKKRGGGGDDDGGFAAAGRWDRHAALDVAAGMSFSSRNLSFTYKDSLTDSQQPNSYRGGIVPGPFVAIEAYPLAFGGKRGALANLGVTLTYDTFIRIGGVLEPNARYQDETGMVHTYNTSQSRFGVGVRYRLPLGDKPTMPTLRLGGGYNRLSFRIETGGMDIDLPDVGYSYLDVGAGARVPLGTTRLALNADLKYLIVSDAGAFSRMEEYGGGSIAGVDVDAGLEFRPLARLVLRGGFRYQRIAFDFDGTGTGTERDGMMGQDVGGALDTYVGGYVTAGYLF